LHLCLSQSRKKGRIEGINKETLVENGMYIFVRHPEFLGHISIISSLVIISQYWSNLVVGGRRKGKHRKVWRCIRDYMRRSSENKFNSRELLSKLKEKIKMA